MKSYWEHFLKKSYWEEEIRCVLESNNFICELMGPAAGGGSSPGGGGVRRRASASRAKFGLEARALLLDGGGMWSRINRAAEEFHTRLLQ